MYTEKVQLTTNECLPSRRTLSSNVGNTPSLSNMERQQQNRNTHRTNRERIQSKIQRPSRNILTQ